MKHTHEFDWYACAPMRMRTKCWSSYHAPRSMCGYALQMTATRRHNKGKHVALAVARGLCYMHKNGVVHRCVLHGQGLGKARVQGPG